MKIDESLMREKICQNSPLITYLLFVDDHFLFFREDETQMHITKHILSLYEIDCTKRICCLPFYLFYVQKVYQLFFIMLKLEESLMGKKVCQNSPLITYLLFVDDYFYFSGMMRLRRT